LADRCWDQCREEACQRGGGSADGTEKGEKAHEHAYAQLPAQSLVRSQGDDQHKDKPLPDIAAADDEALLKAGRERIASQARQLPNQRGDSRIVQTKSPCGGLCPQVLLNRVKHRHVIFLALLARLGGAIGEPLGQQKSQRQHEGHDQRQTPIHDEEQNRVGHSAHKREKAIGCPFGQSALNGEHIVGETGQDI